ncbi:MAG TPA: hypothetical protein VMB76_11000 [Casimicrobiaceae bacterium]|jgi:hypothetical protein|nr:hypothetical protein [Casimicrobiaceae bacterium]
MMRSILRAFRTAVATFLALAVASLPACGTMGGGGMHYFLEPGVTASAAVSM